MFGSSFEPWRYSSVLSELRDGRAGEEDRLSQWNWVDIPCWKEDFAGSRFDTYIRVGRSVISTLDAASMRPRSDIPSAATIKSAVNFSPWVVQSFGFTPRS